MILGLQRAPAGESDPHWASVVSLLSFDESDGSTSYVDAKGRSWTTTGGQSVSHDHSRFGAGSLKRVGAHPTHIQCTDAATAIGSGDFTMECWVRPEASSNRSVFAWDFASGAPRSLLYLGTSWNWTYFRAANLLSNSAVRSLDTWEHVALVRESGTLRMFVSGTLGGSTLAHTQTFDAGLLLGNFNSGNPGVLYLDEFRLTVGVARYASSFTPRTEAFPRR